ncbi:DUF6455 family protein [Paracoccaceae bacterium]
MIGYVEAPMAWGHTHGMARTLGVDLAGAVVDGWLQRGELAALVATCQSCGATPCCSDWLAQAPAAGGVPDFCPNGDALSALAP